VTAELTIRRAAKILSEEIADIASLLCGHDDDEWAEGEGLTLATKLAEAGMFDRAPDELVEASRGVLVEVPAEEITYHIATTYEAFERFHDAVAAVGE
jgi:hypothetical protein